MLSVCGLGMLVVWFRIYHLSSSVRLFDSSRLWSLDYSASNRVPVFPDDEKELFKSILIFFWMLKLAPRAWRGREGWARQSMRERCTRQIWSNERCRRCMLTVVFRYSNLDFWLGDEIAYFAYFLTFFKRKLKKYCKTFPAFHPAAAFAESILIWRHGWDQQSIRRWGGGCQSRSRS